MENKVHLSEQPNRLSVVTDREIACILGSLIGGLATYCGVDKVRRAVRWWAETDEAWNAFGKAHITPEVIPDKS
jgi:hypothetical protein